MRNMRKKDIFLGRLEKNEKKLKALYETGYEDAKESFEDLKKYLKLS